MHRASPIYSGRLHGRVHDNLHGLLRGRLDGGCTETLTARAWPRHTNNVTMAMPIAGRTLDSADRPHALLSLYAAFVPPPPQSPGWRFVARARLSDKTPQITSRTPHPHQACHR